MHQITRAEIYSLIFQLAEDMIDAKDQLTGLDAAIGDGDLGVTMTLGFRAIQEELKKEEDLDLAGVFMKCGTTFADNAASTFGALMSTMFVNSARYIKGKEIIGTAEAAGILSSATEGVLRRGKAQIGDKTVLDAMIPARDALLQAAEANLSLPEALNAALNAARKGADETIGMKSKAGRAGYLGERTIGIKDPGAAAFVMILESISNFLETS